MKHALSALIIVFFVSACGGVESGAPQHGLLGAYASAYEAELQPKIKTMRLYESQGDFSRRDFDDATSELDTFNKKFFGTVKNVFPFRDEPCVHFTDVSDPTTFKCWQVVGDYAVLIEGLGANADVFKDSASGKKFYDNDTILLTTGARFFQYTSCLFINKGSASDAVYVKSEHWNSGYVRRKFNDVCDFFGTRTRFDEPFKSKLSKVKVAISVDVNFSTATLACSEKDCVDDELAKKKGG